MPQPSLTPSPWGTKRNRFVGIFGAEDGEDALVQTQHEILRPTPLPGEAVCCWKGKSNPTGSQSWWHRAVEALLCLTTGAKPPVHPSASPHPLMCVSTVC